MKAVLTGNEQEAQETFCRQRVYLNSLPIHCLRNRRTAESDRVA